MVYLMHTRIDTIYDDAHTTCIRKVFRYYVNTVTVVYVQLYTTSQVKFQYTILHLIVGQVHVFSVGVLIPWPWLLRVPPKYSKRFIKIIHSKIQSPVSPVWNLDFQSTYSLYVKDQLTPVFYTLFMCLSSLYLILFFKGLPYLTSPKMEAVRLYLSNEPVKGVTLSNPDCKRSSNQQLHSTKVHCTCQTIF